MKKRVTIFIVLWLAIFPILFAVDGKEKATTPNTNIVYDDSQKDSAKIALNSIIDCLEGYKLRFSSYPVSLEELHGKGAYLIYLGDTTRVNSKDRKPQNFYYKLTNNGKAYYLLGVGRDGKPFTADDILPDVNSSKNKKSGLRIYSTKP